MYLFALNTIVLFYTINKYEYVAGLHIHEGERIIHGSEAKIEEFPYYAGLFDCGAAILSDRWVVTAAHCVIEPKSQSLAVGGDTFRNSKLISFDRVLINPHFTFRPTLNDIALLHLTEPLNFTDKIRPVALPSHEDLINLDAGSNLTFVGRGLDETGELSKTLKKIDVRRLSSNECLDLLPLPIQNYARPNVRKLERALVCAQRMDGEAGICSGDSGSPLTKENTLVGLASFILAQDCEDTNLGFYVNVASYVPWIKSVTGLK